MFLETGNGAAAEEKKSEHNVHHNKTYYRMPHVGHLYLEGCSTHISQDIVLVCSVCGIGCFEKVSSFYWHPRPRNSSLCTFVKWICRQRKFQSTWNKICTLLLSHFFTTEVLLPKQKTSTLRSLWYRSLSLTKPLFVTLMVTVSVLVSNKGWASGMKESKTAKNLFAELLWSDFYKQTSEVLISNNSKDSKKNIQ